MSSTETSRGSEAERSLAVLPAVPYRGIRPFRFADHAIFFAREEETRLLLRLVVVYRGALLYGASGAGKSSLINAGLIPAAVAHGYGPERIRVQPRAGEELVVERLDDDRPGSVLSLAAFRERLRAAHPEHRPLLIFDQLEELVTLFDGPALRRVQRGLAEVLVSVLEDEGLPVKVLLVFREDYLAHLKQVLGARPELIDQALRLTAPAADALDTIIRGPFERHPGHFGHELAPEVAARLRAALAERFGAGEVSLSEVQTVCLRLWQAPDPQALLDARGIQGILEDYLGEELDAFPPDLKHPAVALLSRMVTASGTRNVISADDLIARVRENVDIPRDRLEAALQRLEGESKLVGRERRRELDLYEITSEFLVPWIHHRQQELVRENERRAERKRLMQAAAAVMAVLAVAALILLLLAQASRNEATRRDRARSRALAAAAVSQLQVDPATALRTALQAYDSSHLPEAEAAVRAVTAQSRLERILGPGASFEAGAYSGDGSTLATSGDGVTLWDPRTGARKRVLRTRSSADALAMDPSGRLVAAGQNDGSVQVWDLATGHGITVRHRSIIDDVAFSPNGRVLATAGQDATARLWNSRSGRPLATLHHRGIIVNTVAFSSDGRLVVSSGDDRTARVWSVPNGRPVATLRAGAEVEDAQFSPDGRRVVTAGYDGIARLWNVHGGRGRPLRGHVGAVMRAAFSPSGSLVATAGLDGTARLWSASNGRSLALLAGHSGQIDALEFNRNGNMLLTASVDGTARLWSVPGAKPLGVLRGHSGDVNDAHFSPDGRQILTTSDDNTARLWRAAATEEPVATLGPGGADVELSRSGRWVAAVFDSGAVRVWRMDAWADSARVPATGPKDAFAFVAFSPDDELLATARPSGGVRLWRAPDWRLAGVLQTDDQVEGVAFRRDGRVIATAGSGAGQLWDVRTRRPLPGVSVHLRHTSDYAPPGEPSFSRDGRFVLFSGGASQLWDVRRATTNLLAVRGLVANPAWISANGDVLIGELEGRTATWRLTGTGAQPLTEHAGDGSALSSDGALAVSSEPGLGALIWATRTGRDVRRLASHEETDWTTFSPSGRYVATTSYGGKVRLWDAATGTEIASLGGFSQTELSTTATISSDDTRIFVSADRLLVYDCDACGPFARVLANARLRERALR